MMTEDASAVPIEVVFNGIEESETLRRRGEQMLRKLVLLGTRVMRVRMVVEARHRHHHQGNLFDVHIHMHCPRQDIDVSRDAGVNHAHEDPYVAMRDAYHAARRKLIECTERRAGQMERHRHERYNNNPRNQSFD